MGVRPATCRDREADDKDAREQGRDRCRHKQRLARPVESNKLAGNNRAYDGSGSSDTETPTDAGRSNLGRIERRRQGVQRRLRAYDTNPRSKDDDVQRSQREARLANGRNREPRDEKHWGKYAIKAEPIDERTHEDRTNEAAELERGAHQHRR